MAFIAVIFLLAAATFGGSYYMLDYSLRNTSGKDIAAADSLLQEQYPHVKLWADSMRACQQLRDTSIVTSDNRCLHALYAYASEPTPNTAVILHGYTANATMFLYIGYLFHHTLGFNIFIPDLHAHGKSDGEGIQMGWKDADDVLAWLPLVNHLFSSSIECRMVIHGTSMGAATAMNVSGREDFDDIIAYIEDSGYTCVWDEFEYQLKSQFGLPAFPLMYTSSILCDWRYGWNFSEASSVEEMKRCQKPMLFIHSDSDDFVPSWMVDSLYQAKKEEKYLWIVPRSAHAMAYHDYPEEYAKRVRAFLDDINF